MQTTGCIIKRDPYSSYGSLISLSYQSLDPSDRQDIKSCVQYPSLRHRCVDYLSTAGIDGTVSAVITVIVAYNISELDIAPGYAHAAMVTDGVGTMRNVDADLGITVLNET